MTPAQGRSHRRTGQSRFHGTDGDSLGRGRDALPAHRDRRPCQRHDGIRAEGSPGIASPRPSLSLPRPRHALASEGTRQGRIAGHGDVVSDV